ncbi:MAG: UDP-N-acetylglucosamine 1-carboxyvinyltransferase, partial [Oscillospiraceae bacterium]|nr:UDP-N-acetylglucosamine 1-carboxyvinyltransferase [Oscillospiraceae bacterium]
LAQGTSIITESIWDSRYRYLDELQKMGAAVQVDGKTAVLEGVPFFTGAHVSCWDLRAGAAMVIAGLAAQGETVVEQIHYIERGYENFVAKLKGLGAEIEYVQTPIDPERETELREIS